MRLRAALTRRMDEPAHGHDPTAAILAVQGLGVAFNGIAALTDVSFSLRTGEQVAVIGPNGAGKSTLFKAVAGIVPASAGAVRIGGSHPGLHICIAYLAQRAEIDWRFPVTVYDVVMMGRTGRIGLFRRAGREDREIVADCLRTVGLDALARRQIQELSGGQQQRMFVARAMAQQAELMLMDEPFAGLDAPSQDDLFAILETLRVRQVTVMLSLHDLRLAERHFDRILLLNRRLIGLGPPAQMLDPELLTAAYGGRMRLVDIQGGHIVMADAQGGGR